MIVVLALYKHVCIPPPPLSFLWVARQRGISNAVSPQHRGKSLFSSFFDMCACTALQKHDECSPQPRLSSRKKKRERERKKKKVHINAAWKGGGVASHSVVHTHTHIHTHTHTHTVSRLQAAFASTAVMISPNAVCQTV